MDIILHIGAHRCGTTTLQQFLQRNDQALGEAGIATWTPDRTRRGMFTGLIQRPQDVTEMIERRGQRSCGVMQVEIARLDRAGRRQLIVSEENMIGAVRNNLREGRLYPLADERFMRFRPGFAGGVTRIGLAIRSYETFWASALAFGVAQGHRVPPMAALDRFVTQPRRWRDLIRDVARLFPQSDLVVWPFERFAGQPDAQLAMLTGGVRIGRPLTGARDWSNASPRCDKLRLILGLRGEEASARAIPPGPGRWMPFDADQQVALRAQYMSDLAWLRDGADGLARLIDLPEPRHGDAQAAQTAGLTGSKHTDAENRAETRPRVPPERGLEHGKQEIVV